MEEQKDIKKILNYIEQNIRVTEQTTIEYLDSQDNISRLKLQQNHIIFGRRGSGKSLLLKSLKNQNEFISIQINVEDFKDISFPDSIIQVQKAIFKRLIPLVTKRHSKWNPQYWTKSKPILNKLKGQIQTFENQLKKPDKYDESIKETKGKTRKGKGQGGFSKAKAEAELTSSDGLESVRSIKIDKLNELKNQIPDLKDLLTEISSFLDKNIFLILDDFYFLKKSTQPYFLDFFHRLSKNTPVYLKVATIKHRSLLYIEGDSYTGIQLPHDAQELDLDYSFEDFNSLVSFMKNLLLHVNKKVGAEVKYEDLFTDGAFRFLCLASGGVPRDFFSLLISLGPLFNNEKSISKPNVIEKAIENISNKKDAFRTDTADEENILEHYLRFITKDIVDSKKCNAFLVSNVEVQDYPQINQAIKELVDMRFLHLVNSSISSTHSDGTRYSAYMVDIGLYPNSNPRGFKQIMPGEKDDRHRQDKIRLAPKINLQDFDSHIKSLNLNHSLKITE